MAQFFSVPATDSHVHITAPEDLAYMKDYCSRFGFDGVNVACINHEVLDASSNILAAILKLEDSRFMAHAGLLYPYFPVVTPVPAEFDFLAQAKEFTAIGFDGMKMLETKPTFRKNTLLAVDHEAYEPYFDYLEKNNIHIVWHSCDPEEFWDDARVPDWARAEGWFYGDGTYVTNDELYREVYAVLDRHPKLRISLAHFFFLSDFPERAKALLDKYENVTLDITPGREMYGNFTKHYDEYYAFFRDYADRIVFGTDMSNGEWQGEANAFNSAMFRFLTTEDSFNYWDLDIRGVGLDKERAALIMGENFRRFCPAPRPVDRAALRRYIDRHVDGVINECTRAFIADYAEKL